MYVRSSSRLQQQTDENVLRCDRQMVICFPLSNDEDVLCCALSISLWVDISLSSHSTHFEQFLFFLILVRDTH